MTENTGDETAGLWDVPVSHVPGAFLRMSQRPGLPRRPDLARAACGPSGRAGLRGTAPSAGLLGVAAPSLLDDSFPGRGLRPTVRSPVPGREASGCVLRPRRFSTGNPRPLVRAAVSVPSLPDQTSPRPAVPEVWFRCVSDGWAGPARGRGPPEPAGFRVSPGSQVLGQSRGSRRCSRHRVRPAEAGSRALPCPVGRRSSSVRPPRRAAAPCVFYSGRHVFPAPGFSFLRHYS